MRKFLPITAIVSLLSLVACSSGPTPTTTSRSEPKLVSTARQAVAVLAPASGSLVSGKVTLVPMGDGVHITGTVGSLPANGKFGFHVHEKGDCSAADATSAGGHFNPAAQPHGHAAHGPHHAGDMDNIVSDGQGVARIDVHMVGVTLGGGAANDIAGRGLIVHADQDDYVTQPTGNAGARVACGVIKVTQ